MRLVYALSCTSKYAVFRCKRSNHSDTPDEKDNEKKDKKEGEEVYLRRGEGEVGGSI